MIRWHDDFNSGDIAFLFLAIVVQILLALPALGLFYQGMADRSGLLTLIPKLIPLIALMSLTWCLWAFSLAFAPGPGTVPEIDLKTPSPVLNSFQEMMEIGDAKKDETAAHGRGGFWGGENFLNFQGQSPMSGAQRPVFPSRRPFHQIPILLFMALHMMLFVAAPIPLLLLLVERIRPGAILLFAMIWGSIVYTPLAHWVWGDGWLESLGVIDSGGGLIQVGIGFSALAFSVAPGRKRHAHPSDELATYENSQRIVIVSLGALAYWVGTSVVNSALSMHADGRAVVTFVNSFLAGSAGALSGIVASTLIRGRADQSAASTGAIAGLVAVATGCGLMLPQSSLITGGTVAAICCVVAELLQVQRKDHGYLFVFVLQGVAGSVGSILASVFATSSVAGFRWDGRIIEGAIEGNFNQIQVQLIGVMATAALGFVGTLIILLLFNLLFRGRIVANPVATTVAN